MLRQAAYSGRSYRPELLDMSVQTTRFECVHCGNERNGGSSYCSESCKYKDKGENFLEHIKHDHKLCSSCFRPLKTVHRPSEHPRFRKKPKLIRDSFIGYQDITEFAHQGEFGLECTCGNVHHFHADELLRKYEPYSWYLKLIFEQFKREGQTEHSFRLETFLDTYWDTKDFSLSVGRALYE